MRQAELYSGDIYAVAAPPPPQLVGRTTAAARATAATRARGARQGGSGHGSGGGSGPYVCLSDVVSACPLTEMEAWALLCLAIQEYRVGEIDLEIHTYIYIYVYLFR